MNELQEILDWYKKKSLPSEAFAYYRCPICHSTWWSNDGEGLFSRESHQFDCWIPLVQRAVKESERK